MPQQKMMKKLLFILISFWPACSVFSQAFFTSNGNGNWNNVATWTLSSGISVLNYPAAGDSVIIANADTVLVNDNQQCQSLTIKGQSALTVDSLQGNLQLTNDLMLTEKSTFTINQGIIITTGNVTINQGATLLTNGGLINIVGLLFLNAPTTAGTSTLNIDGGIFTCAGGLTITATTIPAGRFAEMKIGNSLVNMVGALTTLSANSRINFTGPGALNLAGLISIFNPASFMAGNGKVVYVGIPGSNQAVAPLTYNRLFITGVGNGSKTISGTVTVADTLSLVTDTLLINGGGILRMNNNTVLIKTAGKILSAPSFLGTVDVVYNNVVKDTTGLEMPVNPATLRNLIVNDVSGISLAQNVTVNNKLVLQNGELNTNGFSLLLNNPLGGITSDTAISRNNGYIKGPLKRAIGTSTGIRTFPLGVASLAGYREFSINYTSAPAAGILTVQHADTAAPAQSGFPLTDGSIVLNTTTPYYWQADASGGLSGGNYNLTVKAEGTTGITSVTGLRLVKRPAPGNVWINEGLPGVNSGSIVAPVVSRIALTGFSQFTIAYNAAGPLPLHLLNFGARKYNDAAVIEWQSTQEYNLSQYVVQRSLDGIHFINIGFSKPLNNYNATNRYSLTDNQVAAGLYYYRLQSIDNDGSLFYSKTAAVQFSGNGKMRIYPTAVTAGFYLVDEHTGNKLYSLFSAAGAFTKPIFTGYNNIENLPAGVYYVSDGKTTEPVIKQ